MNQRPVIRFRYTAPSRCAAHYGAFHATIDSRRGTYRAPHMATLRHDGSLLAEKCFIRLASAQAWLREQIATAVADATTFELADYASEPDLEARFKRRAAAIARRRGLTIVEVTEAQVKLAKRETIVRTYRCLKTPATSASMGGC